jgi:hypothetical protein
MSHRARTWAIFIATPAVAIIGVVLFLWAMDIHHDRERVVIFKAATPVYVGTGVQGGCHGTQMTIVESGVKLPIQRIRYLKDCATVDVVLLDGRKAYVVLGVGGASVVPPLPTI